MNASRVLLRLALLLGVLLTVTACGGSSGSGAADTPGGATDTVAPTIPDGADDPDGGGPAADGGEPDGARPDVCAPDCDDRVCGDDGCGGSCGACDADEECNADGRCGAPCVPDCALRFCGSDGCGGSCGACAEGEVCTGLGRCQCVPQCEDRACGGNGCGGVCGTCPAGWPCEEGQCIEPCIPSCDAGCCGEDGCGGLCADRCEVVGLTCDPESCRCAGEGPCGAPPGFPACETLAPAPSGGAAVTAFFEEYAIPLWCEGPDGTSVRDLTPFGLDAADAYLVMFGEVHGSNELGILSAALFEYLVRTGRVNALSMEIGVDLSGPLDDYIRTGGGPLVEQGWLSQLSPNMFLRTLSGAARALYLEGYPVTVFGADVPMIPGSALAVVRELTPRLGETRATVEPLPAVQGGYWVDEPAARSWRTRVAARYDDICAELRDTADCERFTQYSNAVWLSAFSASGALYNSSQALVMQFFELREDFIYYTYRANMPSAAVRVYTHMGAAHTAKATDRWQGYDSVATRMEGHYPVTFGRVYSTTPAYGAGSRIQYGPDIYTLPGEPTVLANALTDETVDEYFASTWRPSEDCVERPQLSARMPDLNVRYADAYDAFTWIRRLTPEVSPGFKSAPSVPVRLFLERRAGLAAAAARLGR
jgi:hypothetical protein